MHGKTTLAAAVLLAGVASAQPLASVVLVTPRLHPREPYRFIGGRTVIVPVTVYGPKPDGLAVRARLVQISSSLAVPIAGEIDVPLAVSAAFASELDLSLSLPAVSRETDFEIRFQSSWPPARAELAAGRIALRVYPANLLEPVRAWAESHALRLEDDHGSLTKLFREQRIAVTRGSGPSDLLVYAGSRSPTQPRVTRSGQAVIVFTEQETATPHLVVDRTGRGTTVTVEMRLLDGLTTDPLAQKIVLEAFRRAVISASATPLQGAIQ
jgi:hypothetical protein